MRTRYKEHQVFLNPSSHFRPKYLYHDLSPKKAQKKNMECDRKTKVEQTIAMTNSQKKKVKKDATTLLQLPFQPPTILRCSAKMIFYSSNTETCCLVLF